MEQIRKCDKLPDGSGCWEEQTKHSNGRGDCVGSDATWGMAARAACLEEVRFEQGLTKVRASCEVGGDRFRHREQQERRP